MMDYQQIVALVVFLGVYVAFATRVVHRTIAALGGAVVLAATLGLGSVVTPVVPEVLLVTAGLMVLGGFVKRSGLAAWLALKASKIARGRPGRILGLTGILSFLGAALLGPGSAVVLVVPVALVLAIELDVPALPFVVMLSWTALLGGATTLIGHPGNLWLATGLGIDATTWIVRMLPYTGTALVVTLVAGSLLFRKSLRVTNERRARVLEYDEARSIEDKSLLGKTIAILFLVVVGLIVAPALSLSPSLIVAGGAIVLMLWDSSKAVERSLGDIEGATLLFYGGLFAVVGALASSGLSSLIAQRLPAQPVLLLWGSALFGAFVDHGAVVGALVPTMKGWTAGSNLWPMIVAGSTVGAGACVWGASSSALALGMASSGETHRPRREFVGFGLILGVINLLALTVVALCLNPA